MTVIDAHQHVWNLARAEYPWLGPELAPINRTIEFEELAPILAAVGVDRTVLVESADNDQDTRYMFEVAAAHPAVAAVVAWAPLDDPAATADRLESLSREPAFAGIRTLIHNQPDPDWLLWPRVDESLALLAANDVPYDVVSVLPRHLEHVRTLSERHPRLRMVIDHLSKPPIKTGDWEPWRTLMIQAAANPLVYAKVSGLYPAAGDQTRWNADDIRPFVEFALDLFGPDRLMFGGDWPISITAGGYQKVWDEMSSILAGLTSTERDAILGKTAAGFYRIPPERLSTNPS